MSEIVNDSLFDWLDQDIDMSSNVPSPFISKPITRNEVIFKPINEMLNEIQPINWLIENYFERNSLNMIFGDPASGKSFVAVDLACSIATGTRWHGQQVEPGSVLYIAGEGNRGYASRCAAWSKINRVPLEGVVNLYFSQSSVNLSDPYSIAMIQNEVQSFPESVCQSLKLIVIDTVARSMGGDENSARDMSKFIDQLDSLRSKLNCTILLVHHCGHGEKQRARGSTVLKGALDSEFRITRSQTGNISMICTKMKEAEASKTLEFKLMDIVLDRVGVQGEPLRKAALRLLNSEEMPPEAKIAVNGKNQALILQAFHELKNQSSANAAGDSLAKFSVKINLLKEGAVKLGLEPNRFSEAFKPLVKKSVLLFDEITGLISLA